MKKEDVVELFQLLSDVYPQFVPESQEEAKRRVLTWSNLMSDQDPKRVMTKAKNYIKTNRFPPTIADLSERVDETRDNDFIRKAKKWEAEAVGKPN